MRDWRRWTRFVTLAIAAAAMLVTGVASAEAASRLCRQLEAQLASASRGGGGQSRKYAQAADRQRAHLSRARAQARQAGCSVFGNGRGCGGINATIRRMERNLAAIERGGGGSTSDRGRILRAIEANRCREPVRVAREVRRPERAVERRERERQRERDRREQVATRDPGSGVPGVAAGRGPSLFEMLRSNGDDRPIRTVRRVIRPEWEDRDTERRRDQEYQDGVFTGPFGTVRTMCVRTCDGYFFPMSASSTEDVYGRDQRACEYMCPGAEMRLYRHGMDEESEAMVALDGTPYTALPTAFAYKNASFARPAGCGCNAARNFSVIAGDLPLPFTDGVAEAVAIATPTPRPDPAADPETLAAADVGMTSEMARRLLRSNAGLTVDRRVRVVGPVFLPDPEGAIDLRTPAPSAVR